MRYRYWFLIFCLYRRQFWFSFCTFCSFRLSPFIAFRGRLFIRFNCNNGIVSKRDMLFWRLRPFPCFFGRCWFWAYLDFIYIKRGNHFNTPECFPLDKKRKYLLFPPGYFFIYEKWGKFCQPVTNKNYLPFWWPLEKTLKSPKLPRSFLPSAQQSSAVPSPWEQASSPPKWEECKLVQRRDICHAIIIQLSHASKLAF